MRRRQTQPAVEFVCDAGYELVIPIAILHWHLASPHWKLIWNPACTNWFQSNFHKSRAHACNFLRFIFIQDIQIAGVFVSIPHQQLCAWLNCLVGAIVYFTSELESNKILLIVITSTVDNAQPVTVFLIPSINNMGDTSIFNYLKNYGEDISWGAMEPIHARFTGKHESKPKQW